MRKAVNQRLFQIIGLLIFALFVIRPSAANASDFGRFHGSLAQAYPHYREALFYLRTGNAAVAQVELEQWNSKWKAIAEAVAGNPPDVYSDDLTWASTLSRITKISDLGFAQARKGDLKAAGKDLGQIRSLLSNLRRSNHVIIFSDYVDSANQAFEVLFQFRHTPPAFDNSNQLDAFRRAVAVANHAYSQVKERAPAAYAEDAEFQRLMKQSLHSLSRLWVAIAEKNQLNLINILREMRSSDRMLYLRFG